MGIASAGGAPPSTPASSTALSAWGRAGVPAITTLIDDLAPIERDTADPATALPSALGGDAARLQSDLTAARRLPGPPSRTVAAVWNETLSELSSAERTMHVAATTLDPAAIALAHQEFAAGGDGLLQLGQAVQASA